MQYTASPDHVIHPATGQRMGTDDSATPTVWSADDANMLIWSLMEVVKDAGLAGAAFNASVPASYRVLVTAIKSISGVPSGALMHWPGVVPPAGWLERNGQAVSRSTYAGLFAVLGTTYGVGDGSTTFNLPDDRGNVDRGWSHGRAGVDEGRALGSEQLDALQNITGTFNIVGRSTYDVTGAFAQNGPLREQVASDAASDTPGITFDASRVVRTATETRMRNRAYMPIIKT